ncbi:virus Gp157 [Paenibacillus sophorae]|uniref:Virus Gp157 n=1 Tax=Paenibacillus sophorae TaxID=1333845 RepID=A0A1H8GQC0_9BACL|nr:siphovirus Gp157 family protein [Paenibacillus sophorae]QWU14308.1 siphovirus Gp157 family protein [Paenibacillus sophorae]SEN46311.1 virus Gp157 [Paenibacillus sophorae]
MKLYELMDKYTLLNQYIEDALDGDLDDDNLQTLLDSLESIEDMIEVKVENTTKLLKNIESEIKIYKDEEERLAKKRKTLQCRYDGIKAYVQSLLEANGIEKVNAGIFKVRLQKNPPSINVLDEKKIPEVYKIPQPAKVDTKTLLADAKAGKIVDGVELITDKKHLRFS